MKKIDLGQSMSTLANLGVIAGIVFLGFELRQSTNVALATASQNMANAESAVVSQWVDNPEIVALFTKQELTDEEMIRLFAFLVMWSRTYENYWAQYSAGVIDEQTLGRYEAAFLVALSFPRNRNWWRNINYAFDPTFSSQINEALEDMDIFPTSAPDQFRLMFQDPVVQE